jgi:hypothetical protein
MKNLKITLQRQQLHWIFLAAFLALVFFTCGRCGRINNKKEERIITDTVWLNVKDSSNGSYQPAIITFNGGRIPDTIYRSVGITRTDGQTDTVVISDTITKVLSDYYGFRYYADTLKTRYGPVYISDTISANRIKARNWSADLQIPEITRTITTSEKKRNEVYAGMLFQANGISLAVGPSIMLKNRSAKIFEAAILYDRKGTPIYQAGIRFKVSLRK